MRSNRWPLFLVCLAASALAAVPISSAFARGGGGSGGRKGGKTGNSQGRSDYLGTMQEEDADADRPGFRDDATREPLHLLRAADRAQ